MTARMDGTADGATTTAIERMRALLGVAMHRTPAAAWRALSAILTVACPVSFADFSRFPAGR
ncbi:hypothetical protein [Xanthomonas pisi]|uniref:hypothetical protein n=1 Tax=Xanthomonas pisi TaxID=56457 RepID=UPI001CA4FC6E|nr:hypothetical protein [Xanthomonas pisi]